MTAAIRDASIIMALILTYAGKVTPDALGHVCEVAGMVAITFGACGAVAAWSE